MTPRARTIAIGQAAYYVPTAVVPFISRAAFERVTGHKTDWWLVLTVSSLVGSIGAALAASGRREPGPETIVLGAGAASALAAIDVVYVWRRRISPVYLLDAAVQLPIAAAWLMAAAAARRVHR